MNRRWLCGLLAAVLLVTVLSGLPLRSEATETMTSSQAMVDVLKKMEGFHAKPYWDNSQWTIGYGTRCPSDKLEEYKETGITVEEAEALLKDMLVGFENYVNNFAKKYDLTFTQNEFDALVSITYNCGGGWTKDEDGILSMAIRSGATGTDLVYAMSLYSKAHTDYVLIKRRLSEAHMYLDGVYDIFDSRKGYLYPDTYRYVFLDGNGGEVYYAICGYLSEDPQSLPAEFSAIPTGVDADGNTFVYTFAGWYTERVGGTLVETLDGSLDNATVLYAQWADPEGQIVSLPKGEAVDNLKITASNNINIRSGPGSFYAKTGTLEAGASVTITQVYTNNSSLWGMFEDGWISLAYTDYEDVVAALDDVWPKNGTVTGNNVNVRSAPVDGEVQYQLNSGDAVVISEVYDDGTLKWGKLEDENWICLSYVSFESADSGDTETPDITGVTLLSGPTCTEYVQMQQFLDLSGTVLQIQYSDGTLGAVSLKPSMITAFSNAELGETTVTAEYAGFEVTFPVNIIMATVTFCNEDGTVLSQEQYAYGDSVTEPEVPPKEADEAGEYVFAGWSPELTTCKGNKTYTAVFQLVVETEPETTVPENSESTDASEPETTEPTEPEETQPPEWPKTGTVTGERVNIRTGAGTNYEKAGYQLNLNDPVTICEIVYDGTQYWWGKLEDGNWICMQYVAVEDEWDDTIPGDMDGNWIVNEDDAIYLLRHIFFPEDYPVESNADFNADGVTNEDDAIYLLRYIFFPEDYPLSGSSN